MTVNISPALERPFDSEYRQSFYHTVLEIDSSVTETVDVLL